MLFAILAGALMFAEIVNYTSMPNELKNLVTAHEPVRPQRAAVAGADAHAISRCAAVHGRGCGAALHPHRLSHVVAVVAQPDAMTYSAEGSRFRRRPEGKAGGGA